MAETGDRRPLNARTAAWAVGLAKTLDRGGAHPDLISAAGIAVAVLGGAMLLIAGSAEGWVRTILFLGAAGAIQLRLLANLMDGLVAVEHGRASAYGPIWNELPDRLADIILLASAGYGAGVGVGGLAGGIEAGWACACLAVLTAYIRELGRGLGFPADYAGPMAKPHRMAALTVAALFSALEPLWGWHGQSLLIGLLAIALGTAFTAARRTLTLARRLRARGGQGYDS
jgi:phosphatidylglycerophosphate synthase